MNEFVYELTLDLNCAKTPPVICSGQFDKGRKFEFTITANGEPFDITGCSAVLKGVRTDGSHFAVECTVSNGKIIKTLDDTTLSVRGKTVAKLVVSDSEKSYSTQMFIIDVDSALDGDITVADNYSILNRLIEQIYALNESGAILIDDTIDKNSNNAVANKPVATALASKEIIDNKVTDKTKVSDENVNYPSIGYLHDYYYDYSEVDDALSGKLDNSAGSVTTDNIASKAVTTEKLGEDVTNQLSKLKGDLGKIYSEETNLTIFDHIVTSSNFTASINEDNSINIAGTSTGSAVTIYFYLDEVTLPAGTYYLKKDFTGAGGFTLREKTTGKPYPIIASLGNNDVEVTFTLSEPKQIYFLQYTSPTSKVVTLSNGHIWLSTKDINYTDILNGIWAFTINYVPNLGKNPMFAWVDDDTVYPSGDTYGVASAKSIADSLGIKCTFACIGNSLTTRLNTFLSNAQNEGFQITNHGFQSSSDIWNTNYVMKDCIADLLAGRKVLADNGYVNIDDFIVPYGVSDDSLTSALSEYSRCAVLAGKTDGINHLNDTTLFNLKRCFVRPADVNGYTLDEYKSFIDTAISNGDLLVFGTHSGIQNQWDTALVTNVFQYVKSKGYTVTTLNKAIRSRNIMYKYFDLVK